MNVKPAEDGMRGYTLMEIALSLAVLAILFGIASTSFLHLAPKLRLQNAVWEINSCLNYARYKAIFEGITTRVKFNPSGYTLEKYEAEHKTWKKDREYYLKGIVIQANNSPMFHPEGSVSNMTSINVSNSFGAYKITLAISGRIKTVKL